MKYLKIAILFLFIIMSMQAQAQKNNKKGDYKKALVSYDDFKTLVKEVELLRAKRLISLNDFLEMQKEKNTIVLDTRSRAMFKGKHLKGAINLPFTEFTQENLKSLIPDATTRVLIYCNNNFEADPLFFASKTFTLDIQGKKNFIDEQRSIMLALNIPTYINLYGYGYKNIYELDELVKVDDSRIKFEGTNFLEILEVDQSK